MSQTVIPVTLLFADGVSHRLQVPCGGKLMEAATEAGLNLLTDCSNGQCGTCTAQLVSGAVEMEDYDPAVLPDEDRASGTVLPCVCRVSSACAIELPYDSSEAMSEEPAPIEAEVTAVDQVATEVVRLEVKVPEAVAFDDGQVGAQPVGQQRGQDHGGPDAAEQAAAIDAVSDQRQAPSPHTASRKEAQRRQLIEARGDQLGSTGDRGRWAGGCAGALAQLAQQPCQRGPPSEAAAIVQQSDDGMGNVGWHRHLRGGQPVRAPGETC